MPNNEVDIDEVLKHIEYRRFVNSMNLDEITFTRNGKPIRLDPKLISGWGMVGLNNFDFVEAIADANGRKDLTDGKEP